jgi:solute carrier family 34 (sodium-dependent phosphate cotransporter)
MDERSELGSAASGLAVPVDEGVDRSLEAAERGALLVAKKIAFFLPAMFLFILAIQLMKAGATALGPSIEGRFPFANAASTLGTGWLGAYFVLSGSPVAATTISLFGAGSLTKLQTLTMLSGSRLGASFIVLLTGIVFTVRAKGKRREESIGMGIQALTMTALVYLPGMLLAYIMLRRGLLDGINWHASAELDAVLARVWGPFVDFAKRTVPSGLLFFVGLGTILVSFKLLDRVLPHVDSEQGSKTWIKRRWIMFALGCLVATLTLSVSVALTVLVPLAFKGYIRRDEALPYIMGANITTLADTLVVAMLQTTPVAARIVLAEAIGVSIVSIAILAFAYQPMARSVMRLQDWVLGDNRHLAGFVGVIFLIPISLLLTGLFLRT